MVLRVILEPVGYSKGLPSYLPLRWRATVLPLHLSPLLLPLREQADPGCVVGRCAWVTEGHACLEALTAIAVLTVPLIERLAR